MVRKKAAVCGEERCVTSLKTAAKEAQAPFVSGTRDNPPPELHWTGRVTFSLFPCTNQPTVYIRFANPSRGASQLLWASCLTSPGRVTLASGATFRHINALARLAGTTREVSCHVMPEFRI